MVATALATGVLAIVIGNLSFGSTQTYRAEFVDATGLVKGDDVRIAGVKVGSVEGIAIVDRTRALVTFDVQSGTALMRSTHADIRYRNLVGQRYISLTNEIGSTGVLSPGSTIPVRQTSPALDLTLLFNGFKPLFQALSPSDVNELSYEIIQVFQGQGGTLDGLLAHTASVTSTLARRDQVIGSLISNLNAVLDHVGRRNRQLNQLITTFQHFVGGLRHDRGAILGSLDQISQLSVQTADLVSGIRAPFVSDIHHLRGFAAHLDHGKAEIDRAAPGDADQAHQDRPHRHLRLVVQLLPLRLHRPDPDRQDRGPRGLRHPLEQVLPAMSSPHDVLRLLRSAPPPNNAAGTPR